jgi:AAHS family 4-hydroxybenzoate transporter-like MFS transporter
LAFWVVFFMSLLDLYLLSNWLPTVLNDLGASVSAAAIIGSMLQVGGVVGVFTLGQFIDRFSFHALALTYFLASIAVAAIGISDHSIVFTTIAIFCAGFCIVGGQTASNALAATFYPTAIRSTGVGWALGIGRVGSIVGPVVGGIMLSRRMSNESVFVAAAVPALCACLASFALSRIAGASKSTELATGQTTYLC